MHPVGRTHPAHAAAIAPSPGPLTCQLDKCADPRMSYELLHFREIPSHEWAAAWRLTLCGLRRSEVLGMTWDCVDLERGEVKVEHGRVLLDHG